MGSLFGDPNWAEIVTAAATSLAAVAAGVLWIWRRTHPPHGIRAVLTGVECESFQGKATATLMLEAPASVVAGDPRVVEIEGIRDFEVSAMEGKDGLFVGPFAYTLPIDRRISHPIQLTLGKPAKREWWEAAIKVTILLRSPDRRRVTILVAAAINSGHKIQPDYPEKSPPA